MSKNESAMQPVLDLIAAIKGRSVDPRQLSKEDRQRVVVTLRAQGMAVETIAKLLQRSERTIRRDITEIQSVHALEPSPDLLPQLAGKLMHDAELAQAHLRRLANEKGASVMERQMAVVASWRVQCELMQHLQSIGYIPKTPQGVVAHIQHQIGIEAIPAYDTLGAQVKELAQLRGGDNDPEVRQLQELIDRGKLTAQIEAATVVHVQPNPDDNGDAS